MKQKFLNLSNSVPKFSNFEVATICREILKNILKYKPIDMESMILNCSFDLFAKEQYFSTYEFFNGKCMGDLTMSNPTIIMEALEKGPNETKWL